MATTKLINMINPEVMADMISAKVTKKVAVMPFVKVDTTLQGVPGNTITLPVFNYIGDAKNVGEGEAIGGVVLTTSNKQFTIKKTCQGVDITDESKLSGYGDPVGEINRQLAKAITQAIDQDAMDELYRASLSFNGVANKISYAGVVDAIDVFEEEYNTEKVIFVHPKQVTQLRKDADFTSADKYVNGNYTTVSGEIGKICNCRVVASKRVRENGEHTGYINPIVKLSYDDETEQDISALTIFLKRGILVETDRNINTQVDMVRASEHYVVALTDPSKVVLATFKK